MGTYVSIHRTIWFHAWKRLESIDFMVPCMDLRVSINNSDPENVSTQRFWTEWNKIHQRKLFQALSNAKMFFNN